MKNRITFNVKEGCKNDEIDNKEDTGSDVPQVIAIFAATLVVLSMGIQFTWTSPTIPILISPSYPINITLEEASYLTICPSISLAITSPLISILVDRIGRKKTLLLSAIPHLITWALIAYGGSIYVFYAARLANGIADAITFTTVSVYIAEVASPKVRATWGNAITFSAYLGNFVMNAVGSFFTVSTTAYIFISIPILFLAVSPLIPETPYYHLMRDEDTKARESLQRLRRKRNVEEELLQLRQDVTRQLSEPGRYRDILTIASNRRALFTGALIRGAQQCCGISAIGVYTQLIFDQIDSSLGAIESVLIVSGLLAIGNFTAAIFLRKIGRRVAMMSSCLGSGIVLLFLSGYFYINMHQLLDTSDYQWFPLACLVTYIPFYSVGLGIIPTIMTGELFSSSIKGKAMCLINISFAVSLSVATKSFQLLMSAFGMFAPFLFFGISCLASCVMSYYFVPETTGKTLEEIQQGFKKGEK